MKKIVKIKIMNIFVVYACPMKSAQYLWNDNKKRGNKMILESCQLLCNVLHHFGISSPYRKTHFNHPASIWVRQSIQNTEWLIKHCEYLLIYYTEEYKKTHKCSITLEEIKKSITKINEISFLEKELIPFVNCARSVSLNLDFTTEENVHKAYRSYLAAKKNIKEIKS